MALDIYWGSVSLAMHMDGANASTSFVDTSGKVMTAAGNAKLSTTQKMFGGTSGYFDGTGDYVSTPYSSAFDFGAGAFTVEFFTYHPSNPVSGFHCPMGNATAVAGWRIFVGVTGNLMLDWMDAGSVEHQINSAAAAVPLTTWVHVAVSFDGVTCRGFVAGNQVFSSSALATYPIKAVATPMYVGTGDVTNFPYLGYIDEVRITKGVARYTAAFTAPTEPFTFGSAALVSATAPRPTLSAFTGPVFDLTAPVPTLLSSAGAVIAWTAPTPTLSFIAHASYGENAIIATAPAPTLAAYFGGNAALTAPAPTLSVAATGTALATAYLSAPAPTVDAAATGSYTAYANLKAPTPNLVGYGGAVCSITTSAGTLVATGTAGGVARAALSAPLPLLSVTATAQNHASAILVAPAGRMAAGLQAYLIAPTATLTAIGTAVVAATYEAYALNLSHTDPTAQDELTRYTNFPFTHVVRYKNSYFGVSSGALYLLEGATDNTTPIPFNVKTATTDFGAPEQKTVQYAYFGGRMGAASTVSITAGETAPVSYNYTTPRGPLAQNYRQPFGRGIKARYFSFGVSGSDALDIDSIDIDVLKLKRRI